MNNYSANMAYWPASVLMRWGSSSLIPTLLQLYMPAGTSHLTSFLTWELSYFQT